LTRLHLVLLCRNKIGTTHQGPPRLLTTQHNNDNKAIDWLRQGRFYPLSWSKERWMGYRLSKIYTRTHARVSLTCCGKSAQPATKKA